jgi:protein TonB
MDLQEHLLESSKLQRERGGWKASATSIALHGVLIGGIIFAGAQTKHSVAAEKQIEAFITQGAAPPPPPPPPPPKKASGGAKKAVQQVQQPKPVVVPQQRNPLTPPVEIPKVLPKVDPLPVTRNLPVPDLPVVEHVPADDGAGAGGDAVNGVTGGVDGGVAGGVVGGELGGIVGGQLGGVQGGELGGKLGGEIGGKGTGTEGTGTGGPEAPVAPAPPPPPPPAPEPPAGPLRVGGDVKAPVVVSRVEPTYTDSARKARVTGTVVVEAIIDKNGNVDHVKVVKGLPAGLGDQAEAAVRRWKFKPGTLNGRAVDTIFNLTVTFKLE